MRKFIATSVLLFGLSHSGQAAVISTGTNFSASGIYLEEQQPQVFMPSFNSTLGTLTAANVRFTGEIYTDKIAIQLIAGDPVPATITLTSDVSFMITLPGLNQTLPSQVVPVINDYAQTMQWQSFDLLYTVPLNILADFAAQPEFSFAGGTRASDADGHYLQNIVGNPLAYGHSTMTGQAALSYIYTPKQALLVRSVPEPSSLTILAVTLLMLAWLVNILRVATERKNN